VDANYKFITVDMGEGGFGNKATKARFWPQTFSVSSMKKEQVFQNLSVSQQCDNSVRNVKEMRPTLCFPT
jgi:hypothetical protein